jgi:hypothetical protein
MNKFANLLLIFFSLIYLVPIASSQIDYLKTNPQYFNIFAGLIVAIVQFSYNLWMIYTKRKDMNMKNNLLNSLFKGLVTTGCYYIYKDIKDRYQINSQLDENNIKAGFVIMILILFILAKSLISP